MPLGLSRLQVGAVVELTLETGQLGYVQYTCPGWHAPVIRVCPGVFDALVGGVQLVRLVGSPSLFQTQFDIDREVGRRKGRIVATLSVPEAEAGMPPFTIAVIKSEENPDWLMVKEPVGETISGYEFARRHPDVDPRALPMWGIPFYPTLSRMIETQWTPSMAQGNVLNLPDRPGKPDVPVAASEPPTTVRRRPLQTLYYADSDDQTSAEQAASRLQTLGLSAAVEPGEDNEEPWVLFASHRGRPNIELEQDLVQIVTECGGTYGGNMVGPLT